MQQKKAGPKRVSRKVEGKMILNAVMDRRGNVHEASYSTHLEDYIHEDTYEHFEEEHYGYDNDYHDDDIESDDHHEDEHHDDEIHDNYSCHSQDSHQENSRDNESENPREDTHAGEGVTYSDSLQETSRIISQGSSIVSHNNKEKQERHNRNEKQHVHQRNNNKKQKKSHEKQSRSRSDSWDRRRYRSYIPSKEEWVLANYNFFIRPPSQKENSFVNEKLWEALENPDALIDWDSLEILRYRTEHVETCPICMDEFIAPRSTKCGHLYCLSCILRYLDDSEYTHRKCPMCNESVHTSHLKPVIFESRGTISVGNTEKFLLMKREKISTISYGADKIIPPMRNIFAISGEPDADFNKYVVMYDIDIVYQRDLLDIRNALTKCMDETERSYLKTAEKNVQLLIERWNTWMKENVPHGDPTKTQKEEHIREHLLLIDNQENSNSTSTNGTSTDEPYYFFFQSADGNLNFLDPISSRALAEEYGSFAQMPTTLEAKVTHVEKIKVDDYARRKYVFTKHIPLHAEITILEIDIKPLVSSRVYHLFSKEIAARERKRRLLEERSKRDEENARRAAELEEARIREEMEKQRFIWKDSDFPKVDQYGAEIVPDISEFVPLEKQSKKSRRQSKQTGWGSGKLFIPGMDFDGPALSSKSKALNNTSTGASITGSSIATTSTGTGAQTGNNGSTISYSNVAGSSAWGPDANGNPFPLLSALKVKKKRR